MNAEQLKVEIEKRTGEIQIAVAALNALYLERIRLRTELIWMNWKVKVGSLVVMPNGKTYQVSSISAALDSRKPWIYGRRIRKDGQPESRSQGTCLFDDWTVQ